MAGTRNIVAPEFAERATIRFSEALPGVQHVQGRLVEWTVDGGSVELADGTVSVLRGRVSILATGSRFPNPLMRASDGSMAERKALYGRYRDRIESASRILIIGGGPIGVEVAGEISDTWPSKQITLVDRGTRLLKGSSEKLATEAARILTARGVTIVTGEALDSTPSADPFADGGEVQTDQGRRIAYDLLIWATGGRPETWYMRPQFAALLDQSGRLKVDPQLRVIGLEGVFAIGDINNVPENKMAIHILGQAKIVEQNIRAVLSGRDHLAAYKPKTGSPLMLLALGKSEGVSHVPVLGVVKAGWFNRMVKTRNMLVPRFRQAFGLKG
jgi:NADH dehydrogenase FAD-containing subunit